MRDEGIKNHKMEKEYYEISQESADLINDRKGRLFCVGTTSFKTLQSATEENGKVRAEKKGSELFIYPGVKLNCKVDYLITNFHLPKSTLILLVSAFVGREIILNAYHVAVNEKYRFYSFGDAMLIKGCD